MIVSEKQTNVPNSTRGKERNLNFLYIGRSAEVKRYMEQSLGAIPVQRETYFDAINYLLSGVRFPRVILCDTLLSGGTGIEMHHFIRQETTFDKTVFILVAETFTEEEFKSSLANRVDDYFVLPLPDPRDIRSRVRFLMEYRSRMQREEKREEPVQGIRIPVSKRVFDVVVASSALIILAPFLVLVMAAIRIESKGKVYYTSRRVGRKPFNFFKFRSMRTGADAELGKLARESNKYAGAGGTDAIDFGSPCRLCPSAGHSGNCSHVLYVSDRQICEPWYHHQKEEMARSKAAFIKIKDDPRITRVGKIIRDLSIDELPQLVNVIKGDMSLVGNRPLPIYEAEKLTDDKMARRFLSPAGLTGLWQVELRGKAGMMSESERKRLDNKYAAMFIRKKYSIWYDLKLILRTIPAIFQKETV